MKLSEDQIEIERKKFEAWLKLKYPMYVRDWGGWDLVNNGEYEMASTRSRFDDWLACRESNNEITVPDCIDDDDTHDREKLMYNRGLLDCASAVESQGFHVKSQGE